MRGDIQAVPSSARRFIANGARLKLAWSSLLLLTLCPWAHAVSVDSATTCVDETHFEFDVFVSGLEDSVAIFRIGADSNPFQAPNHRIAVNFDPVDGTISVGPQVDDSGDIPRWVVGPFSDFTLTPVSAGAWRVQGRVPHGTDRFEAGDVVWSVLLRSTVGGTTTTVGPSNVPISACDGSQPPPPNGGPSGGDDVTIVVLPGETVNHTFNVNGPVFPIALSAEIGNVVPDELSQAGTATYTLTVPAGAEPGTTIEDFIVLTDEAGTSSIVNVTILIDEATEEPPPETVGALNLSGTSGSTLSGQFAVDGQFPISLSAEIGSVAPAMMNEPGNATYTLIIDAESSSGTTIEDTITLIDADGIARIVTVSVAVVAPQELAEIPILAPNEQKLAQFFDDVCPELNGEESEEGQELQDLCTRLRDVNNTPEQIAAALLAINPEEIMAATASALRLTRVQHGNLSQRINALRSGAAPNVGRGGNTGGGGVDVSNLNLRIGGKTVPGAVFAAALDSLLGGGASADEVIGGTDFGRWGIFANGTINFGDQSRTANEAGFDFNTHGITAGVDYRLRDNAFLGVAFGFARVDVGFDDRGGNMDIDSWNLSVFGTYFHEDKYYVDAMVNLGRSDYDSARHIRFTDATGSVDRTAQGSTGGQQLSFSVASGYDFNRGRWTVGPHAGSDRVDATVRTMQERGAGVFNMIVGKQRSRSWTLNAGGHASYTYAASWGVFIPHVRMDFVRELETARDTVTIRLAADPFNTDSNQSPVLTLQADRPDPSYFVLSAGASAQFIHGFSGFINYQRMAGMNNLRFSQFNIGMRVERHF